MFFVMRLLFFLLQSWHDFPPKKMRVSMGRGSHEAPDEDRIVYIILK